MGDVVAFPERVKLARLRRAHEAEMRRIDEQELPLPDKRARKAAQAYYKALFRADGWFAD
jgi:hypothetical protein